MMKFLIIGLGSMGKRRIRNIQALKAGKIVGFDLNENRRQEAREKYNIETIANLDKLDFKNISAIIVSTPPDKHNPYIKLAIKKKKPVFVEASAVLEGLEELNRLAEKNKILVAPSCTMRFYPAIKAVKRIVKSKKYGRVTNFSYHIGQYLPDWHPWENVKNFYAGKKKTSGSREMFAFELTWIVDIVGFPKKFSGFFGRTMNLGANIDDTYVVSLDFGRTFGNFAVDVVARCMTRSLIMNMEKGQILWRWDENFLKLYDAATKKWKRIDLPRGRAAEGYDKNTIEEMYIDEVRAFIGAVKGKKRFPNSLSDDIKVLKILYGVEKQRNR